ncbi:MULTISPECIES: Ig-like domain-containing protein [unclassified Pseudomonas]|uniref:Ig-like domain-containing protein n=1 Tax=unclassified Pseudomonas TaxID=196821 RepID=UPI002892DC0B|nr:MULTISPECIES: Ig-like domain-containing protein [unclassified Pseudomonas]
MNDPVVQANENLVCNGEFEEAFEFWTRTGRVLIGTAYYDNMPVKHIKAPKGAGISQDVTLPKDLDGNGTYWLSFLWESSFNQSGWVRISQGETEHHFIELKPASNRDHEDRLDRLGSEPARRFSPTLHEVELTSAISESEPLRIELFSSNESPNPNGELWVTRIKLELKLAPLELQEIQLDGMSFLPSRKMYLCQGANSGSDFGGGGLISPHILSFVPVSDNPWDGTPVALSIDNNPQGAIVAKPAWDTQQSLDLPWTLDCPLIDDQDYEFTLSLRNRYTAQAYEIPVSLGHHRLIFREVVEAAYYPLIEQTVRLGVQVASYYTGQPFAGLTVNWSTAGQGVLAAAVTDEQGWAYFDYEAKAAGDFIIEASVVSLYYEQGVWTQTFDVLVLGEDPWAQLTVVENNETRYWIDNSYPNRGSTHSIDVMLAADSRLRGSDFYLYWHGDRHEQLGVVVSPPLETAVPMPVDEGGTASWSLTCEDQRDGMFELSLVCSKLLLPSPRKCMSLARNRIRIKEVRQAENSPVVEEYESAYLRLQVVHVTDQGDGEPVIGAKIEWLTANGIVCSQTGSGGWGSLKFYTREPGIHAIAATVRAHESAEPHQCEFTVTAIASSSWKDKLGITFDRGLIDRDSGVACTRGRTHSLEVTALARSPLIGQKITLAWGVDDPEIGLEVSHLGEPRVLLEDEPLIWTLSSEFATSRSSMFGLRLLTDSLEDRELLGRLFSPDIHDEFTLVLDQMSPERGQSLYPCLGAVHRYIFRTHALSALVGLAMDLQWNGTPAAELGIVLNPPLRSDNVIDESGMTWTLDCSASRVAGSFRINFILGLWGKTDSTTLHLGHNKLSIETVRESAVYPVVGQEPAWMWVKVRSDFSQDAMVQVPTWWTVDGHTEEQVTADDGWAAFAYGATTGGLATVEVAVTSPYDNVTDARSMEVCSLADDPWARLQFSMDNGPAQPFGQNTCFPRRKLTHRINMTAPGDTFLSGRELTLGMVGAGPEALGIRFAQPVLGLPRVFSSEAGFTDSFSVDDKRNGSFGLFLACDKLARWSPVNAMSVGEGAQVVKIAERPRGSQTLLWGEALSETITIVSAISGRPMVGMNVVWRSPDLGEVTTTTNFYGEARIRFVPKNPGAAQLTVTVGDAQYSESISLPFFLHEPREIKELVSDDLTGHPGQEMTAQALVVSADTGEPLANVEVMWEYDNTSLPATLTDAEGKTKVHFVLGEPEKDSLLASVRGGIAGWDVRALILDIVESRFAAVESVVATPNPVPVNQLVTMTAQIVDKQSRKPMPFRKILVSRNNAPFIEGLTDREGKYTSIGRPVQVPQVMSLTVKVENPDGSSDTGSVQVEVVT